MFDGSVKHSCALPEKLRADWGCEVPVKESKWALVCHSCLGEGRNSKGEVCEICNGEKRIAQPRCPNSTRTELGLLAFQAYTFFKNHQILPQLGGMLDQSSYFVKVIRFCDYISSVNDKLREEHNERIRQMQDKLKSKGQIR